MGESLQKKWFLQDRGAVGVAGRGWFGISGHKEDFEGGMGLAQALGELASAEVGHDDVGEQEIDGARLGGMVGGETKSVLAIFGEEYGVALALEKFANQIPDAVLIFD